MTKRYCLGHGHNVRNCGLVHNMLISNQRCRGFVDFVDLDGEARAEVAAESDQWVTGGGGDANK